ncbi:hypothetical protein B296_00029361 [Ensete ventricosum]|uniref:Uncharacterized protein n=1 Tax=Ensete ventricosum TaxID=4639 RepID=A0A427AL34_ENSVE|nr:hypothetical protein B296_00029361 [Ensete ventricosum]
MIAQRAPETSKKRLVEVMPHPQKKVKSYDHHKSRHSEGGSKVREVQAKMIAQRAPKTFRKRPAEAMPYPRKKVKSSGHHKSRHDRGGSKAHSSKGKE